MTSVTEHWRAGLLLKVNDTRETRWLYFATVVQGEGWLGPKLQLAKRGTSQPNRSGQCGDRRSLLKDEPKHQEADKAPEHSSRREVCEAIIHHGCHWSCWPLPRCLTLVLHEWFPWQGKKKLPFGWLEVFFFFFFLLHHFGFVWFGSETFPHKVDQWCWSIHLGPRVPSSVFSFAGHSSIQRLFDPELSWWTTWEDWESSHWTQGQNTMAHHLNRTEGFPTAPLKD